MAPYVLLAAGACAAAAQATGEAGFDTWAVDPLVKVFRDAQPEAGPALAEVACGEHASLQIVVRSEQAIKHLHAEVGALKPDDGGTASLQPRPARYVGYVPVTIPTPKPPKDELREVPGDFPDPLLEVETIDVAAGEAQAVWITVPVPMDAAAGMYRGWLEVTGDAAGRARSAGFELQVRVYPVKVGPSRLKVTNWFNLGNRHLRLKAEVANDPGQVDERIRRFARNMAEHRQNAAMISALGSADVTLGEDGQFAFDFSRFDKLVNLFIDEGVIGYIEGSHVGTRSKGWKGAFVMGYCRVDDGKVVTGQGDPKSPEVNEYYRQALPALVRHLRKKGWLDRYFQHLADEPVPENATSYREMAQVFREYAPELKIIEACHTKDLVGAIDIWVPQLNYFHEDYEHYRQRKAAGEEIWFYTCLAPQGEYANRFIVQRLIKTRLLHWLNFRYGATGYLHWGYNYWWHEDVYANTARKLDSGQIWPAGDPYIVYPGPDGPWDSIRWEAMRDGIADYELLSMLAERDADAAMRLVRKHIVDFSEYDCSVTAFRATRRALLERLAESAP
jgi:hypothetical protein